MKNPEIGFDQIQVFSNITETEEEVQNGHGTDNTCLEKTCRAGTKGECCPKDD